MERSQSTPPLPWSPRMHSAGEVLMAYQSLQGRIAVDLEASQKMNLVKAEAALIGKLEAATLQVDQARATMWIIYDEEQTSGK